ncbi:unnamed protein product [Notodromas monacha]|uniref:Uncharacterized protein n=1 Tax=Notodromas monacha TaxID=399045 RepID=A0A7R9GC23_9CRUS|nr:unnamed protein product [Notodromas monacha]CAG0917029.1 unnamed protein product [Notodromas monacha]
MFGGFFDFASSSSSMSMSLPSTFGASSSSTAERDHMMPELPSGALKWESDWNSSSLMLNDEPCSELLNFPDDFDLQLPPPPVPLTATATAVVSLQHDSELPGSLLLSPSSSSSSSLTSTGSGSSSSSSSSTLALASGNAPSSPGVMHVTSTQLWATPDAFAGFTANAHLADTLGAVGSATDQTVGLAQVQNCSKFLWTKPASRPTLSLRAGGSGGIAIESVSSLGAAAVAAAADDTNNDFSDIVTPDLIHSLGGAAPALLAAAKTDEDVDIDVGDIKDLNPFYNWNFDSSSVSLETTRVGLCWVFVFTKAPFLEEVEVMFALARRKIVPEIIVIELDPDLILN